MYKIFEVYCPKCNKSVNLTFETISTPTFNNSTNYILGLLRACSNTSYKICPECPCIDIIKNNKH